MSKPAAKSKAEPTIKCGACGKRLKPDILRMCQCYWCCYGCGAELPQLKAPEIEQTVKLCVLAVEHLTRPPKGAGKEHRYRRGTAMGMIGHQMFPEKRDENGIRIQGPKNSQGAALAAGKWVRRAIQQKLLCRDYDQWGYSSIILTTKGEEMAKLWAKDVGK